MARFLPVSPEFRVSSGFGSRWGAQHNGVDYACPTGTPIYAAADGVVVQGRDRAQGSVSGFGSWIWIDCQQSAGVDLIYGHVQHSGILVRRGDRVRAGQQIGVSGNEGNSTGPHLHFEVWGPPGRTGGRAQDPAPWLAGAHDPTKTRPQEVGMDARTLSEAMGGTLPLAEYERLLPGMVNAMRAADITTVNRAAMWCAQLGHESAGLRYMEEIASGQAYEWRQDLGNTQAGDGRRFKGSGPIQLTGRHNFTAFSRWAAAEGHTTDPMLFVNRPELVRTNPIYGFLAASWYWTVARPNINPMSDRRDLEGVTRAINGGLNGLADRRQRYNRALAMGDRLLPKEDQMTPEQAKMLERVHHELTHRFQSRVVGEGGEQSPYRDTLVGYGLQTDAAAFRTEVAIAEVLDRLDKIEKRLEDQK